MVSSYRFSTLVAVAPDGQYAAAALDEQDAAAAHAVAPDEQDAAAALDEQDAAAAPDEQDDAESIAPCCLPGGLSALAESPGRLEGLEGLEGSQGVDELMMVLWVWWVWWSGGLVVWWSDGLVWLPEVEVF